MNKEFSIKPPGAWLWTCGVSYDEICQKLEHKQITEDWLVCPFGESKRAVRVSRIDELRVQRRRTRQTEPPNANRNSHSPSYIVFRCPNCQSRIRLTASTANHDAQYFRCTNCGQRYCLTIPESDGIAFLVTQVPFNDFQPSGASRPSHIVSALRALDLSADCSWNEVLQRYRNLVAQYHPDKVQHLGPELQQLAAKKTKEYNRVFELLERFFDHT